MEPGTLLLLALLGGALAVESTGVGQFMLSRPMVAGALTGWLLGAPAEGFAVGTLLEIYLLVALPVGGARFPEGAPATVIAVATYLSAPGPGSLALGVSVGLVWGQLGGVSVTALRNVGGRIIPEAPRVVTAGALIRSHLLLLAADLTRGTVVTGTGLVVGTWSRGWLAPLWPLGDTSTRGLLLLGGIVSLGILVRSAGGVQRRGGLLTAGVAAGLAAGLLL